MKGRFVGAGGRHGGPTGWLFTALVVIGLWTGAFVTPAEGQDSARFHATLRGWADDAWLSFLDRNGSAGGRLATRGTLQRFQEDVDDKYLLDRLTAAFLPVEDYEWYARDQGVRWNGASITKRDLVVQAELKAKVSVGKRWAIGARIQKEETPQADRSAIRVAVSRDFSRRTTVFAEGHLDANKPGSDIELGVRWKGAGGASFMVGLSVLDFFNDMIYLNFDAVNQSAADSTLEYERQPIALRGTADIPLGSTVRVEAYGAWVRPSTILSYEGRNETDGFRQREWKEFAGGLIEWAPTSSILAGVFASSVWAKSDRSPLTVGVPIDPYVLHERTTQLGALGVFRLTRRWMVDSWVRYSWLPERRTFDTTRISGPPPPDVDYLLISLNAQALLRYEARGGFRTNVGILVNRARIPRGDGQVPARGSLSGNQFRIRWDIGTRPNDGFQVMVGAAMDLDADGDGGPSFGGARGRFMLFW